MRRRILGEAERMFSVGRELSLMRSGSALLVSAK